MAPSEKLQMNAEGDQPQRVARSREQAARVTAEMNAAMEQRLALLRCDQCAEPKQQQVAELSLPNGLRLVLSCRHCQAPGSECTAQVHAHLASESPAVANRIVSWLIDQPALQASGVGSLACGSHESNRLLMTFRVPVTEQVAAALQALPVEEFRGHA